MLDTEYVFIVWNQLPPTKCQQWLLSPNKNSSKTSKMPCRRQHHLPGNTALLVLWKSYESPRRETLTLPGPAWAVEVSKVSQWRQNIRWGLPAEDFSRLRPWEHFPEKTYRKGSGRPPTPPVNTIQSSRLLSSLCGENVIVNLNTF